MGLLINEALPAFTGGVLIALALWGAARLYTTVRNRNKE
jgi:hypothetical protein